jgi:protein transport protein SEC23
MVEYAPLPVPGSNLTTPLVFFFVIDTYIVEEELVIVKTSLTRATSLVSKNALLGFITFGGHVQVYKLGFVDP